VVNGYGAWRKEKHGTRQRGLTPHNTKTTQRDAEAIKPASGSRTLKDVIKLLHSAQDFTTLYVVLFSSVCINL